jgi:hypothetical protein
LPPFWRILKIIGVGVLHFVLCCVIIKAAAREWGLPRGAKTSQKEVIEMQATQKQISATDRISQGALAAQKRLLSLLRRIDQSAQIVASMGNSNGELDRLYQRRKGIVEALKAT